MTQDKDSVGFLNNRVDFDAAAEAFARDRKVRIAEFFKPEIAGKIHQSLTQEAKWKFATRVGDEDKLYSPEEWAALGRERQQEILIKGAREARVGFHYSFEYFQLLTAYMEKWNPDGFLHQVAAFIRSDAFAEVGRKVTGFSDIVEADCQATRYQPGHYLTMHHDHQIEQRRAAYVLGFTLNWRPDWGGLLQFFDDNNDVTSGFSPTFNTLSTFSVPQNHAVSYIAPCAGAARYTITGWFLTK